MSKVLELCEAIENHYKSHKDNCDILTLTKIIRLQHERLQEFKKYGCADCNRGWDANKTLEETNRIAGGEE